MHLSPCLRWLILGAWHPSPRVRLPARWAKARRSHEHAARTGRLGRSRPLASAGRRHPGEHGTCIRSSGRCCGPALCSVDRDRRGAGVGLVGAVGNIHHQGTVYGATLPAVPFVAAIAQRGGHPDRVEAIAFLREIAVADGSWAPQVRDAVRSHAERLFQGACTNLSWSNAPWRGWRPSIRSSPHTIPTCCDRCRSRWWRRGMRQPGTSAERILATTRSNLRTCRNGGRSSAGPPSDRRRPCSASACRCS